MSNISDKTKAVCAEYFGDGCVGCPLVIPCEQPVKPLTLDTIKAHADRINRLAEESFSSASRS